MWRALVNCVCQKTSKQRRHWPFRAGIFPETPTHLCGRQHRVSNFWHQKRNENKEGGKEESFTTNNAVVGAAALKGWQ